jgi:hypothetical protein
MLHCTRCGVTQEAACDCGVGYLPAREYAAKAIAENPEKSDRAIAAAIGIDHKTVAAARQAGGEYSPPEKRTGRDGKSHPSKKPKLRLVEPPTEPERANAKAYFTKADDGLGSDWRARMAPAGPSSAADEEGNRRRLWAASLHLPGPSRVKGGLLATGTRPSRWLLQPRNLRLQLRNMGLQRDNLRNTQACRVSRACCRWSSPPRSSAR